MRTPALFPLVLIGIVSACPAAAHAQKGQVFPKLQLSDKASDKLKAMDELGELPPGEWRTHAGDMPHGEDPALSDVSWASVSGHDSKGPATKLGTGPAWIRRTIEIPKQVAGYNIAGAHIWFQAHVGARGAVSSIIYINGNRVALGEDLEPVTLTDHAQPGQKFMVAVKLLDSRFDKSFSGVSIHVTPADASRPNPADIRVECTTAAEILPYLPKPRPDLLPTVESAVAAVDMDALKHNDNAAFDASLRKAEEILAPLHSVLAAVTFDEAGNSHIDAAWLWPKTETVDIVHRTFATAIQLMREYPDYTYTQSAAQYSQWVADKWPDLNKEIAQRVKEGRWEIVGGMWVEPDLNLPGGESIVRQLLVGQRTFKDLYGVVARIGWNPDTFGYNWQMPQIYKRSGLDYFVTQKMTWNDTNQLPLRLFWWQGLDGSKILTYFPNGYANGNASPSRVGNGFAQTVAQERNPGTTEIVDLYGIGDHGGGPSRLMLDEFTDWINKQKTTQAALPTMRFSTFQAYLNDVQGHLNPQSPMWNYDRLAKGWTPPPVGPNGELGIPTWNDELYLEKHRGVYTTQAMHKWNMRHSEDATIDAEKFASVAWLDGANYPGAQFTDSWKAITFNQFHDLAAGSGIGVIYKDAQKEYDQVFASDKAIDDASHKDIAAHVDTSDGHGGVPVLVWNTMSWPRSGMVEFSVQLPGSAGGGYQITDAAGKSYPYDVAQSSTGATIRARVENVPAMGYKLLHVSTASNTPAGDAMAAVQKDGATFVLSNKHLTVTIRKSDGCVTSLTKEGKEFLAPNACANELQAIVDKPKEYDAWDIDPGTYDAAPTKLSKLESISLLDDSGLHKTVRITRSWSKSKFTEDITLNAADDFVTFSNTVDWHEEHVMLKAAFPFAATAPKATYEIPFGAIQRETTRDNSITKARFEVSAQRWADLGDGQQGVSLLNDGKYGYDTLDNVMRLTLLRSPKNPDPDADMGIQHMRYALYPHAGTWQSAQTVHRGYEFDVPMVAEQVFAHGGKLPAEMSFAAVDAPNVVLAAVKKAEDSNALIFRVYETSGMAADVALHVPAGSVSARETNLMEAPADAKYPVRGNTVHFAIKPFEIRTIEVSYPAK